MLARLIFTPLPLKTEIPVYRTRFEALSSALVFLLVINPRPNENNFHRSAAAFNGKPQRSFQFGPSPPPQTAQAKYYGNGPCS
eukprot:6481120-Amphidinium_carterae.1